jgi:hypothetical protein
MPKREFREKKVQIQRAKLWNVIVLPTNVRHAPSIYAFKQGAIIRVLTYQLLLSAYLFFAGTT